jgi:hypothetical protein
MKGKERKGKERKGKERKENKIQFKKKRFVLPTLPISKKTKENLEPHSLLETI